MRIVGLTDRAEPLPVGLEDTLLGIGKVDGYRTSRTLLAILHSSQRSQLQGFACWAIGTPRGVIDGRLGTYKNASVARGR
jgi:hypothetical protein